MGRSLDVIVYQSGQNRVSTGCEKGSREGELLGGVDGCRRGWVLATTPTTRPQSPLVATVRVVSSFGEIAWLLESGELEAVGVDIPIGLPPRGARACDLAARRLLGARRSSVFPAPPRALLGSAGWEEASVLARTVQGVGISRQTFHLLAKIAEVDRELTADLQERVFEVHPELAFAAMVGQPMLHPKRSPEGRAERAVALGLAGYQLPRLPGAASDDTLDALAALWSTRRCVAGVACRLGDGNCDARGLRMEISY